MTVLVTLLVLAVLVVMPASEVLLGMFAWLALVFGVGVWMTTGFHAAAGVLCLVPVALVLRFVRLRVAARLW